MDDYNINSLTDTRNEYCALFINRITPLMIQGIYSIFEEACKLCADNDEDEKYLMTFQNFLGRISKWNQDIIDSVTEKIKVNSGCSYLEDLLTCVHVTQLKMLTSVRVGQKQKKVDIAIPKLNDYIHKSYIEIARKVYKNAFLFEVNVSPLVKQKHMRELEMIVRESLLNVIRDNMPIEEILRAYIDETTEEDVYEVKEDTHEVIEDVSANAQDEDVIRAKEEEINKLENETQIAEESQAPTITKSEDTITLSKSDETPSTPSEPVDTSIKTISTSESSISSSTPSASNDVITPTPHTININTESNSNDNGSSPLKALVSGGNNESSSSAFVIKKDDVDTIKNEVSKELDKLSTGLSFNNEDHVKTYDTTNTSSNVGNTVTETIDAPKTVERLEEISTMRNEQRKLEEMEDDDYDDDEKIKIFNDSAVSLDILDVNNLSNRPIELNKNSILGEITTLA